MKKVLSSLIMAFTLSFPISSSNTNYQIITEEKKEHIVSYFNTRNEVFANVCKLDSISYHSLDSIPIYSPIKTQEITKISSDYGMRIHPIIGIPLRHKGLDITAHKGANILSTACGVVEKVKLSRFGYGNEVIVRHSNGYKTRYAHLENILVNVGDTVKKHQIIGTLGKTGLTTGYHLHYEILKNERDMDPMFFTYNSIKNRSIKNYTSTLITLEYM